MVETGFWNMGQIETDGFLDLSFLHYKFQQWEKLLNELILRRQLFLSKNFSISWACFSAQNLSWVEPFLVHETKSWAKPNIEPSYLKYRLHEFIVKFNVKFIKGFTYDVVLLGRESILKILTSCVKKKMAIYFLKKLKI
jgi:hypothetical protein